MPEHGSSAEGDVETGWDSANESVTSSWSEGSSPLLSQQSDPGLSPLLLSDADSVQLKNGNESPDASMDFLFGWKEALRREELSLPERPESGTPVLNGPFKQVDELHDDEGKGVSFVKKLKETPQQESLDEAKILKHVSICPMDDAVHYGSLSDVGDVRSMDVTTLSTSDVIFSKEYAELSFICRVLDMALDRRIPLLDRWMYLCIVSSNLDEQFAKRLGSIPRFADYEEESGIDPARMLKKQVRPRSDFEDNLTNAVRVIVERQHKCLLKDLLPALEDKGVQILPARKLSSRESEYIHFYFRNKLHPVLTPMAFDATHPFPLLQSDGLYVLLVVTDSESRTSHKKVYFRIPADSDRLIPVDTTNMRYAPVEEVIVDNIALICQGVKVLESYTFRVTRNTKLAIDDANFLDRDNLLDFVYEEVHRRRSAPATRLEVQATMPEYLQNELRMELFLDIQDVYSIPGPLLGLGSCISLAFTTPLSGLKRPVRDPSTPSCFRGLDEKLLSEPGKIFSVIKERDVLVQYPHHKFSTTALLFLRSAARDPKVKAIKMVIYRAGNNSPLLPALIRAAKNGKEVTVLVELKASFDEVKNSEYARRLYRAGCNVTYGLAGLKTHCKTMLVVRQEGNSYRYYSVISTGNWNPSTAKMYTDLSIFTSRQSICDDVVDLFNTLSGYSPRAIYRHLLIAPGSMLSTFLSLIDEEALNKRAGRDAAIVAQVNGLTEPKIAEALYKASQVGVPIQLIVRGSCRLRPGIPGISDNIRVFSWVGPVLQHRRIWYFCANGRHKYYIGSADWRSRNLNERVELAVPVEDFRIKRKLSRCLESLLHDPSIWRMAVDGRYYKPSDPDMVKKTAKYKQKMKRLKNKRRLRPTLRGDDPKRSQSTTGSSSEAPKKQKEKRSYQVNIRGNQVTVDKIKAGAALVRWEPTGSTNLQVLLIWRDDDDVVNNPSIASDPFKPAGPPTLQQEEPLWSVVKGTIKDEEDAAATAQRLARTKAGVIKAEQISSIGWVYRPRRTKKTAVAMIVLKVKEERSTDAVRGLRKKQWFDIRTAINWAIEHKDAFLRDVLSRTMHAATAAMQSTARLSMSQNLTSEAARLEGANDADDKAPSMATSEDSRHVGRRNSKEESELSLDAVLSRSWSSANGTHRTSSEQERQASERDPSSPLDGEDRNGKLSGIEEHSAEDEKQ